MRYGDECEGKMLDAKGDNGDKVMELIKNANTLLEVNDLQKNSITIFFRVLTNQNYSYKNFWERS